MKDYKKILEGVVDIINNTEKSDIGFANICTYIGENCPELKESEDERIRKDLIVYLKSILSNKKYGDKFIEDWIAWLEKQGEKLPVGFYYVNSEGKKLYSDTFKYGDVILHVEKQGEQKPTDKPKFNVGDILVSEEEDRKHIYKVDAITNYDTYLLLDLEDGYTRNESVYTSDLAMYLWTIQDAKDGDVLSYSDNRNNVYLCIYREYKNERVYDYCTLDKESFWEHGNWNYLASFNYAPATKEQRNTLEKAMADAGYTFDFEKKELKKIEQSPIDVRTIGYWHVEDVEQKPAWSEEDSPYYDDICEILINLLHSETADVNKGAVQKDLDWLVSLRPQSQWKPSDEQIEILNMVLTNESMDDNVANILRKLREQLKKLREELL